MPVSITKAAVSEDTVKRMAQKAFGEDALEIQELKEGYFNIAYRVRLKDRSTVLKIAPSPETEVMTFEKNIMFSEVDSMRMAARRTEVPVPEVLFYDNSRSVADREYFFMEMLEGQSLSSISDTLSQEQKQKIYYDIGRYTAILNRITGAAFGYYGQPDRQGEERDRALFEAVETPRFVHWDIWAGNVFIADGRIQGFIDFERCLWGDPLMEVGFRGYERNGAFLDGYGLRELSREEDRRARWYDVYLALLWCLETDYRGYDNRDFYHMGCRAALSGMEELSGAN